MVHFLRCDRTNIAEVSTTEDDLSALIYIKGYSEYLLALIPEETQKDFIKDFSEFEEIRGSWFEATPRPASTIDEFVEEVMISLANKWDLDYVVD